MALGDAYATPQDYRTHPLINQRQGGDNEATAQMLQAVARFLDRKLGQVYGFNKDAAVTTRVYWGGDEIAPIASTAGLIVKATTSWPPDWASITALVVDEDFELLPLNALTGPESRPYTDIRLAGWSMTPPGTFLPKTYYPTEYRVQVTAIHGWPAVPAAIKQANIILASMLAADSLFASGRIQEIDQAIDASPQARALLRDLHQAYSRYPVVVG